MGLFDTPDPEQAALEVIAKIDPEAVLYKERDHRNFGDKFTVRWTTLGLRFGYSQVLSDDVVINIVLSDYPRYVTDYLIQAMMSAIMEAYVEFWHLYYTGPSNLREFCAMKGIEFVQYLESNGEYIPGRNDYARICRLQQRDAGRYPDTERLIRENS